MKVITLTIITKALVAIITFINKTLADPQRVRIMSIKKKAAAYKNI